MTANPDLLCCLPRRALQLVRDEEVGDFTTPPQQQRAQRGAGYDAESGRASPSSERYGSRVSGGGGSASSAEGSSASGGASPTNVQSAQRGDSAGRLWEGTSQTVAVDGRQAAAPAGPAAAEEQEGGREGFQHFSMHQGGRHARRAGAAHLQLVAEEGSGPAEAAQRCELSPGRHVGEIMRRKVEQEGWQLIVQGHR